MKHLFPLLLLILFSTTAKCQSKTIQSKKFAKGIISLEDIDEASPSLTSNGQIMVFARTTGWQKKVPYIAKKRQTTWQIERLNFTDTLYNLAITPDGQRIIFKKQELLNNQEISRTFVVEKQEGKWLKPREVSTLFNINAGYFSPVDDGTLYFFARSPKTGIYYAEPDSTTIYSNPKWLSDKISPAGTDSFDVLMHPKENQLIITRFHLNKQKEESDMQNGFYWYKKTNFGWQEQKRLPLNYGWGASIIADKYFLHVKDGDLHFVTLASLGLQW